MTFSTMAGRYAGGAFVGEHGSWDRAPLNGYKVIYVPFADGRPSGKPVDALSGFIGKDGKAHGRPVAVTMDTKGGLLVADDLGQTVWRVSSASG
jgi:glucose/arabinose dehydrogenase